MMKEIIQVLIKLNEIDEVAKEDLNRNCFPNNIKLMGDHFCHDLQIQGENICRNEMAAVVSEFFAKGHEIFYDETIQKISFELIIRKIIEDSDIRRWEMFKEYEIHHNATLQVLADSYDLTRERIRQIIKKFKERELNNYIDNSLMNLIYSHLLNNSLSSVFILDQTVNNDKYVFWGQSEREIYESLALMAFLLGKRVFFVNNYYVILSSKYKSLDTFLNEIIYCFFEEGKLYNTEKVRSKLYSEGIPTCFLEEWISSNNKAILHGNYFFYRKKKLTKVDKCKFVLLILGEPAHFSAVHKLYSEIFQDGPSENSVHALMDRGRKEGIVRTFTGTFGLEELGEKQHTTIQDIATKIMIKYKKEYDLYELINDILKETEAKANSILTTILTNKLFLVTKESTVILRSWRNDFNVEETGGKNTFNEHGTIQNYDYLKYTINEFTIKYNRIRIPYGFKESIKPYVFCIFNEEEILLKYDSKSRLLVGIDKFIHDMNLNVGNSFYMVFSHQKFYIINELDEFEIDEKTEIENNDGKDHVNSILQNLFGGA